MRVSVEQRRVLAAVAAGWTLKAHRYLDGRKEYRLHALDGAEQPVRAATIAALTGRGLLGSNNKFPAATFWLTPAARELLSDGE